MIDDVLIDKVLTTIKNKLKERKTLKQKKVMIGVLKDLHSLSVTIHGRMALVDIINDENDIDPEIKRLFYVLVQTAPIEEWSHRN